MAVNPTIEVFIDKLVLKGLAANQQQQIAEALQSELTRLLSQTDIAGSLQAGSYIPVVKAGSIQVANNTKGRAIGNKIAHSVYKSFTK